MRFPLLFKILTPVLDAGEAPATSSDDITVNAQRQRPVAVCEGVQCHICLNNDTCSVISAQKYRMVLINTQESCKD